MRSGLSLWILLVLVVSCANKTEKVTRQDCEKVADHIAQVIMDHYVSHPDELWAGMSDPYASDIPRTVTKETFEDWLASPTGKTWTMQRHGQVRSSAEAGIQPCVDVATPALVTCLLAAKTREDVTACDKKYPASARGSNAPPQAESK